jgi:hypothetical protein
MSRILRRGLFKAAAALAAIGKQAAALRRAGADLVVAVVHATKPTGQQIMESRLRRQGFARGTGPSGPIYHGVRHCRHAKERGNPAFADLVAQFPHHRHANRRSLSRSIGADRALRSAMVERARCPTRLLALALDRRSASVRGDQAAIDNLIADAQQWVESHGAMPRAPKLPRSTAAAFANHIEAARYSPNCPSATGASAPLSPVAICGTQSKTGSVSSRRGGQFPQLSGLPIVATASAPRRLATDLDAV